MTNQNQNQPDWQPSAESVAENQVAAYDAMRDGCPVAYSEQRGWSAFTHADVKRIVEDHHRFSNVVSQHLSVPNGMDPPEHTAYRQLLEPYFSARRMSEFEPVCRGIAAQLIGGAIAKRDAEVMEEIALPFAAAVQCAFLGWPQRMHQPLIRWTANNEDAARDQNRPVLDELAREFEAYVDDVLESRRQADAGPHTDVTAALMHEKIGGRTLSNEEISSVLRNWTVGEVGTIAASVGILIFHLAEDQPLQSQLRADPSKLPAAIDEMLRLHGPLVNNRRVTTCPVKVGGRQLTEGERVSVNWISANRDEQAFEDPTSFRLDRDPANNLLYGSGIHVCPGAPLARLEMQVLMEELLCQTTDIQFANHARPIRAVYPASGYASLPITLTSAT